MRRRVLFVCTANSARSLMAEAVLRELADDRFEVASAGTDPVRPHPLALQVLEAEGYDTGGLRSKPLEEVQPEQWDYVITLCDKAAQECGTVCPGAQQISWDFADPVESGRKATFALTLQDIRKRVELFVMVHQKQATEPEEALDPVALFKALGDESRLAMMLLVRQQEELCVCELTTALDASQPKVSRHLGVLRDAGLLESERRSQWIYYRVNPRLPAWALRVLDEALEANRRRIRAELKRLATMPDRPPRTDCA